MTQVTNNQLLYKYRSITDFKRFIDIVVNQRLYAPKYEDLNDPMEGHYIYSKRLNNFSPNLIYNEKIRLGICSLSKEKDNQLMWSHYADGDKGVAIGVKLKGNNEVVDVQYSGLLSIDNNNFHNAQSILSHKLEIWSYENEVRVFVKDQNYVEIYIYEIIVGSKVSNDDYIWLKGIINNINPKIKVVQRNLNNNYF
jgi:hypothetical protein